MAKLIKWVGFIWAVIGIGNTVMLPWGDWSETALGFGLLFNGVLFVLPGLVVYGIGERMSATKPTPKATPEERLDKLADMKQKGIIDDEEYEVQRRNIIAEL